MKNLKVLFLLMWLFATMSVSIAQTVDYLTARPLSEVVTTKLQPVKNPNKIPMITWGGDLHTVLALQEGIFASQGLSSIELFREDDFKKQVEMCLRGEIPAIRGTLAMINAAAEIFQQQGTDLVVVYAMTTSEGGDCIVWREGKNLNNISTVALQLYGPHMDYAANLFTSNNRIKSVQFKWLQNLTISDRVSGKIVDPVTAFQVDKSLDATMCIIPDGLMLTSGGEIGDGSDGSTKGARIGLSTKTANRVIYDVYAFRRDYFDANKSKVESFVKSLFLAEEMLRDLSKNPQNPKFVSMISKGASYFQLANNEVQDLLLDCRFLGYNNNVSFFTGAGTTRSFTTLNSEISTALKALGILKTTPKVLQANWDYAALATGLKNASSAPQVEKRFDQNKAAAAVERRYSVESESWQDETTLFYREIYFQPNQEDFKWADYAKDFDQALKIAQTYGGALIVVEGHSDHGGINKARREGTTTQVIQQMEQNAKNLSLKRAENARKSYVSYCKNKGIKIDESQLIAVGRGVETPKYKQPRTKEEWQENFRVVFVVKQIEAELDAFDPSAY